MSQAPALRPMGLLQIVDQTFRLYRANFWLFFGISAIVYLPIGAVQGASPQWGAVLAMPLILLGTPLVIGALTKAVSDRYMGEQATVVGSYRHIVRRLLPFILTLAAVFLLVLAGLPLALVGAVVFYCWALFVTQVFIIEDKRYFAAIWRSKFLIGNWMWVQVLAVAFITNLLASAIATPFAIPGWILIFAQGQGSLLGSSILAVGSGLGQALAQPIGLVASILLYYDSRIRKEGFDLEVLARELGKAVPPQVAPPPPPAYPPPVEGGP